MKLKVSNTTLKTLSSWIIICFLGFSSNTFAKLIQIQIQAGQVLTIDNQIQELNQEFESLLDQLQQTKRDTQDLQTKIMRVQPESCTKVLFGLVSECHKGGLGN